jgi:hypothetical protein
MCRYRSARLRRRFRSRRGPEPGPSSRRAAFPCRHPISNVSRPASMIAIVPEWASGLAEICRELRCSLRC